MAAKGMPRTSEACLQDSKNLTQSSGVSKEHWQKKGELYKTGDKKYALLCSRNIVELLQHNI